MDALESLEVWQRGCRISVDLYRLFSDSREYGLKDQITRAGLSIPSNIAEGYERNSPKEFVQFLRYAKGSCGELKTQLFIAKQAKSIDSNEAERITREVREISSMIYGLIRCYSDPRQC